MAGCNNNNNNNKLHVKETGCIYKDFIHSIKMLRYEERTSIPQAQNQLTLPLVSSC